MINKFIDILDNYMRNDEEICIMVTKDDESIMVKEERIMHYEVTRYHIELVDVKGNIVQCPGEPNYYEEDGTDYYVFHLSEDLKIIILFN